MRKEDRDQLIGALKEPLESIDDLRGAEVELDALTSRLSEASFVKDRLGNAALRRLDLSGSYTSLSQLLGEIGYDFEEAARSAAALESVWQGSVPDVDPEEAETARSNFYEALGQALEKVEEEP